MREFESGAVRDDSEGKGRCDLLPLGIIGRYLKDDILLRIDDYMRTCETKHLWEAMWSFSDNWYTNLLEVARQFEDGAKKYGDNNWKKGIPIRVYLDSGVRHYLKFKRGDTDEHHDRAFLWNMLCAIWTHEYELELGIRLERPNCNRELTDSKQGGGL